MELVEHDCSIVRRPLRLFRVRTIPLCDMTCYELVELLDRSGWTWKAWTPPSQRKKDVMIPDSYKPGGDRIYYTTMRPLPEYLRAVLTSEDAPYSKTNTA
jgi:hypothetical protein